jgi:hypothetical protein
MGLDMYLNADVYISTTEWQGDTPVPNPQFTTVLEAVKLSPSQIWSGMFGSGISVEVPMGYWRKANHIHAYFVRECGGGVDECQKMFVSREQISDLKVRCETILKNNHMAEELLPPQAGFFFGSTDIDEWYLEGLKHTIEICNLCLASDFDYFNYQASW